MCIRDPIHDVTRVLGDKREFACSQVEMIDIVNLWVFFVHADQKFVWKVLVAVDDLHLHILKRRQVSRLPRFQARCIQAPVFVAANILDVHDVLVIL